MSPETCEILVEVSSSESQEDCERVVHLLLEEMRTSALLRCPITVQTVAVSLTL